MDTFIKVVKSHLRLCEMALEARTVVQANKKSKLSRHYARVRHTRAMLSLVRELQEIVDQDPDLWRDEDTHVGF